jgi:hypothetical protein
MSNILDTLGISNEDMKNGEASTIVKPFEPLKSGVYTGIVKEVFVYKNQWDGSQMRYNVEVETDDGEKRIVTFRSDIGKELKDKTPNKGYAGRLKQFSYACNVPVGELSSGTVTKEKIYGKEVDATPIIGFTGKTVKALVRFTNDTNKEEGVKFKYTNDIQGVLAPDGTEDGGENGEEKFLENVAKTPIFTVQSKTKAKTSTSASAATTASGKNVDDML